VRSALSDAASSTLVSIEDGGDVRSDQDRVI
jgi:hypothetical protein